MNDLVEVEIEYIGFMSKIVGKKKERTMVADDLPSIGIQISAFLKNSYGITQPVLILVGGKNILSYIKEQKSSGIKAGTCFKVMPIMSGG